MTSSQILVCITILLLTVTLSAQDISKKSYEGFNREEKEKIHKAESLLDQGLQILFPSVIDINDSALDIHHSYLSLAENLYLDKKTCRRLYETKDYFSNGYRLQTEVYLNYINDHLKNKDAYSGLKEIETIKDSVLAKTELAKSLRQKSMLSGQIIKAGRSIHQANLEDDKAIALCLEALDIIKNGARSAPVKEEEPNVIAEIPEKVKQDTVVSEALVIDTPKEVDTPKVEVLEPKVEIKEKVKESPVEKEPEVYYTVQILADRKPVSSDAIKRVYQGEYEIIENIGDGWYRYSFGKFSDLTTAKKALSESNAKGYVVAYRKNIRISLSEAKKYFLDINP
ncbi:hypothetical protein E9993_13450 [Labilibacter sediminis]|nr:hypothetical protein E9993_13450 [Labilibacter sediminis]